FVFQRVEVRSRYALDKVELIRVRETAVCEPELFIEVFCVNDQHVAFPPAESAAVISGEVFVIFFQRPAVCVNQAPIVIAAADEDEDSLPFAVLEKLHPIRKLKLTRTARRHTKQVHRVASQKTALS